MMSALSPLLHQIVSTFEGEFIITLVNNISFSFICPTALSFKLRASSMVINPYSFIFLYLNLENVIVYPSSLKMSNVKYSDLLQFSIFKLEKGRRHKFYQGKPNNKRSNFYKDLRNVSSLIFFYTSIVLRSVSFLYT